MKFGKAIMMHEVYFLLLHLTRGDLGQEQLNVLHSGVPNLLPMYLQNY